MRLPDRPHIGLVLSYSYLWADQARAGHQEGLKSRPVAIVVARRDVGPSELVYVVPITHSPPASPDDGRKVFLPAAVKRRLGLDDEASWIDVTEFNVFVWPGPDLRPVAGARGDASTPCFYGFLPNSLFKAVKLALERNHIRRRVSVVRREG